MAFRFGSRDEWNIVRKSNERKKEKKDREDSFGIARQIAVLSTVLVRHPACLTRSLRAAMRGNAFFQRSTRFNVSSLSPFPTDKQTYETESVG